MAFNVPPIKTTDTDDVRNVGFEIEFTGLTLTHVTSILSNVFGGELKQKSEVEYELHTSEYGKFKVELDWEFLKNAALEAKMNDHRHKRVEFLHQMALSVVPLEIVFPPFPLDKLDKLDEIIIALREAGARGTDDSVVAAFGVHINPEIPSLDVATFQAYLRAFGLLQWWLNESHEVNFARKMSPYIKLYSEDYVERLLAKNYEDLDELIDDYLAHNPSRNRALDMLPLFAYVNEDKVKKVITDSKVNARPTFHYRLPNCLIEHTGWSFASSWNIWHKVEVLAADPDALAFLSRRFKEMSLPVIGVKRSEWIREINLWIKSQE
ncbi:amidoligase family protein [Vibrio palustris]|uniref:Putative amidoligase enzyme n=1 Tax=Vibrio palustris TaxID=1918946 RepID=A0A1R4B6D7_9VIBR|nr:amidoligase family protein [Vibrio palustris]SJL84485.1 Putative amidoligase enzyme [Vibrio palustris]